MYFLEICKKAFAFAKAFALVIGRSAKSLHLFNHISGAWKAKSSTSITTILLYLNYTSFMLFCLVFFKNYPSFIFQCLFPAFITLPHNSYYRIFCINFFILINSELYNNSCFFIYDFYMFKEN